MVLVFVVVSHYNLSPLLSTDVPHSCFAAWGITIYLLRQGITTLTDESFPVGASSLWRMGFGSPSPSSLITFTEGRGLISNVLLANLPQLAISLVYLSYNGVITCMLLSSEWMNFAHQRKTLRTTVRRGQQRSSHYLQLPYSYAIPLMIASSLLHWLISQSIFLVRLVIYDNYGIARPERNINACGYSSIAIIFALALGGAMILAIIVLACRSYPPGMPLVGSCSAAISAACHAIPADLDAALKPVKWGVVNWPRADGTEHATFTTWEVEPLTAGTRYA
jgi:hypothetical protein